MIFLSDLDRTLIFSHRRISRNNLCVERIDDREISYMTPYTAEKLCEISERITFIPVTMRSQKEFRRISFPEKCIIKYAVCDNGGTLLINGIPDEEWKAEIDQIYSAAYEELRECVSFLEKRSEIYLDIRLVDDRFLYTKSHTPIETIAEMEKAVSPKKCGLISVGDKIYAIPHGISKGEAVRKLKKRFPDEIFIAAGDSLPDTEMLRSADIAILKYGDGKLKDNIYNPKQYTETECDDPDYTVNMVIKILEEYYYEKN